MSEDAQAQHAEVTELILDRLRYILDGNGGNPENVIPVTTPEFACYKFPVHVFIRLRSKVTMRHEHGKNTEYPAVTSQEEFRHKTQDVAQIIAQQEMRRQQVIDIIRTRPDRGFGLNGKTIPLKGFTQNLVWHEECESCNHTGKMKCPRCDGRTREVCPTCHGSRLSPCPHCSGVGRIQSPQGQQPCPQCNGTGRIPCATCGGQGQIPCRGCGGTGKTICGSCHGRGYNSHIAHIEVEASLESSFEPEEMPKMLSHLIGHKSEELFINNELFFCAPPGPKTPTLLKGPLGLGQADPDQAEKQAEEEERRERNYANGVIPLDFYLGAYFGIFEFNIEGEPTAITVIGEGARPLSSSHFLERLTIKGIKALKRAAHGSLEPVADVARACKYKIWRTVMAEAVSAKPARVIAADLQKEYPVGVSPKTLMEMANSAITVLRHVTRVPRYLGMLTGQAMLGLFCAYYFFHGGQRSLAYAANGLARYFSINLSPDMYLIILYLANALFVYLGYVGSKYLGQIWGRRAQKKIIESIMKDLKPSGGYNDGSTFGDNFGDLTELPPAGLMKWWSLLLSILIVAMCLYLKV